MKLVVLLLAFAACTKKSDTPKPSPAAPAGELAWHTVDPKAPVGDTLAAFARDAKAAGLKPYAYLHASWCGPCNAIDKTHAADPQMVDAFKGTAIAMIDIDAADPKALSAAGLETGEIPVFFRLDDHGTSTGEKIDGAAWGDNIPANMAPPLKAFFAK